MLDSCLIKLNQSAKFVPNTNARINKAKKSATSHEWSRDAFFYLRVYHDIITLSICKNIHRNQSRKV